jgi:hypothetical protein
MSVTPNSSKVGEIPEGLLKPQTIKVGLYEKLKLNGTEAGDCYAVELRRQYPAGVMEGTGKDTLLLPPSGGPRKLGQRFA